MMKKLSKIMIIAGSISLIMGSITNFNIKASYADNLEVIGTDIGLEVSPSGTKLFDLTNLNPGDEKEAIITIKNNYISPFEVFMRTERSSPQPQIGEADLFEQLILTIYLNNIKIYSGPMKDYAATNISLGDFQPNSQKELRAIVHLPGPETGNEFQGKSLQVKWYFIAELKKLEPPRESPPIIVPRPGVLVPSPPEIIIIEEDEIPLGQPEVPEEELIEIQEEIPKATPEIPGEELVEIEEDEIAKAIPKLPKTGELSPIIFYATGILFIIMGAGLGFKKEK